MQRAYNIRMSCQQCISILLFSTQSIAVLYTLYLMQNATVASA
jgi:hypothetical protein